MCVAVIVGVGVVVVEMQWRRVGCDTVASCSSRRELGACNEDRFFSDSVHPSLFMLAETLLRCQPLPARKQKEVLPIYPAASIFVRGGRPQRRSGERLPLAAGGRAQMVCAGIAREPPFQIVPSKARRLPTRRWSKTNASRVKHGAPEASAAHTVHVCDGGHVLHGRWLPDRVSVPGDAAALGRDHRDPLRGWHEPFCRPVARYPFRVPAL